LGGLSKKSFLVKELSRESLYPALLLSSGNMLFPRTVPPEERAAARITAEGLVQATRAMGGTVMGVGSLDLSGGLSFLQSIHHPPDFTLVSSNLVHPDSETPLFAPVVHQRVGELRVAFVGLTDHTTVAAGEGFKVLPWQQALEQRLAAVQEEADFILLLSNYPMAENQAIARKLATIDCIFQAGHVIGNVAPTRTRNALISQTDIRGKYLGVLDIAWNGRGLWAKGLTSAPEGKDSRYRHRFVSLPISAHSDPEVEAIVKQTQRRLNSLRRQGSPSCMIGK
jgi:2',3'-cyclic-nucleotide 2'-phosphodiesterase (5'-nucleotidase family)